MIDNEAAVHHLQEEKLALQNVHRLVGVVLFEDAVVLLTNQLPASHYQVHRRDEPTLLDLGGQVDTGRTEKKRIHVPERVSRVEPLVVDYGRGDDLLTELQGLRANGLNKVREENVDFL